MGTSRREFLQRWLAVAGGVAVTCGRSGRALAGGLAVAGNSAWDGGTKAEATANGIDADSGRIETTTVEFEASLAGAPCRQKRSRPSRVLPKRPPSAP